MSKVFIGSGNLAKLDELIDGRKHLIIADEAIAKLINRDLIPFNASEENKNLESISSLTKKLQEHELDRESLIISIGGGNTSDVVGFLASIYFRGLPWISVPTTLLAMADGSIGGKTAVNFDGKKNILGSFHPPESILINLDFLNTLAEEDYISGMAEIIKIALILDEKFLEFLESHYEKILNKEAKYLEEMIKWAIKLKMDIVEKDLKEEGIRKILNYGHTFAHAIERAEDYKIPHGHAVALGIQLINEYAVKHHNLPEKTLERTQNLLKLYGLPTEQNHSNLRELANSDKKRSGEAIDLVILKKIGTAQIIRDKNFLL